MITKFEIDLDDFFRQLVKKFDCLVEEFHYVTKQRKAYAKFSMGLFESHVRSVVGYYESTVGCIARDFDSYVVQGNFPMTKDKKDQFGVMKNLWCKHLQSRISPLNESASVLAEDFCGSVDKNTRDQLQMLSSLTYDGFISQFEIKLSKSF